MNRRNFIAAGGAAGALGLAPGLTTWAAPPTQPIPKVTHRVIPLDRDWTFSRWRDNAPDLSGSNQDRLDRAGPVQVTLPHCVSSLSWQKWDPASWEYIWQYQRSLEIPTELRGLRLWLHFERVMVRATPILNGHALPEHAGGFLPFECEITEMVKEGHNTLTLIVDSRWSNVPPAGSPKGPASIDYMLPGGICGSVELRAVPNIFIRDVFAKPVNVLNPDRRLEITCTIDCGLSLPQEIRLAATLHHKGEVIASMSHQVTTTQKQQDIAMVMGDLHKVHLWDIDHPQLYDLSIGLSCDAVPLHSYQTRIGFREARFEIDGFFLNGKRLQLFGLNRHELYPYVGFAAPRRAMRRDAEYLRHKLNCNVVRCSHYPQSQAFLDACNELGLLVWEEIPGWQYLGDAGWQDQALKDVAGMVRRDRNHASIVVWGVRINESANDPELYRQTTQIAKSLDNSRPTSGTMTPSSKKDWREHWRQDIFAFDDYHAAADGSVGIEDPLPDVPYLIAEAVGQFAYGAAKNFSRKYRRAGDPVEQAQQAILHAQAHSKGAVNPRCSGVIAWCAFDYASLINAYNGVKCPGIADIFRIPKLGAAFYLAQVAPSVRPVIEPGFYWDFGPRTPAGPGPRAAIFSNCSHLEIFIDGQLHGLLEPDRQGYPNVKYPPFFADLSLNGEGKPELRMDGYIDNRLVLSRSFSSDALTDHLRLHCEDAEIQADGSDAASVAFGVVDKFGAPRPFAVGEIHFQLTGPGVIVGDNPFAVDDSGGVGAIWIKSLPDRPGRITLDATHKMYGTDRLTIDAKRLG